MKLESTFQILILCLILLILMTLLYRWSDYLYYRVRTDSNTSGNRFSVCNEKLDEFQLEKNNLIVQKVFVLNTNYPNNMIVEVFV